MDLEHLTESDKLALTYAALYGAKVEEYKQRFPLTRLPTQWTCDGKGRQFVSYTIEACVCAWLRSAGYGEAAHEVWKLTRLPVVQSYRLG